MYNKYIGELLESGHVEILRQTSLSPKVATGVVLSPDEIRQLVALIDNSKPIDTNIMEQVAAVKDVSGRNIKILRVRKYRQLTSARLRDAVGVINTRFADNGYGELIEE